MMNHSPRDFLPRRPGPFWRQSLRYLLRGLTLLLAVSLLCFVLIDLSPVDPVQQYLQAMPGVSAAQRAEIEAYWGLDEPLFSRYTAWLGSLLQGDLGISTLYRRPVAEIIGEKFLASLALMLTAWLLAGLLGFAVGCLMGLLDKHWLGRLLKRGCLILCSIPTFWLGIVLLMIFSLWLGWFPFGMAVPLGVPAAEVTLWQRLHHLLLPALTLSLLSFANIALHTREKLHDVLHSDYARFARARGESRGQILRRHGLRNTLLPALTMQFASFNELFGGAVLAENVFSYPGLGAAAAAAGLQGDAPLLLGITLFSSLFVFTGNLLATLLYGVIDPRIRAGETIENSR